MSGTRKHLFLALTPSGWGETALGVRAARQLQKVGDEPVFLVHQGSSALFHGGSIRFEAYEDHIGPLFEFLLDDHVASAQPASIILADFSTTADNLRRMGLERDVLHKYNLPIIAMDTWNFAESGFSVDIFAGKSKPIAPWIVELPFRFVPVPFVRTQGTTGACLFLPEPIKLARKVREHVRSNLGLAATDRAVLMCTAGWQQAAYDDENGVRIANAVPALVGHCLNELGPKVHLIHVGPAAIAPLQAALGERYHWMPPLATDRFEHILGSVDLMLSLNVSATTMSTAIASNLPLVVIQNSCAAQTVAEARAWLQAPPSDYLSGWLEKTVPLYPFSMWPLGFYHFLAPVLRDNDYCTAFEMVELLDEGRLLSTCRTLLFESTAADALRHRQANYIHALGAVPTVDRIINSYLES